MPGGLSQSWLYALTDVPPTGSWRPAWEWITQERAARRSPWPSAKFGHDPFVVVDRADQHRDVIDRFAFDFAFLSSVAACPIRFGDGAESAAVERLGLAGR
jgi:hypothetical protein